jgi:hypothetical protein
LRESNWSDTNVAVDDGSTISVPLWCCLVKLIKSHILISAVREFILFSRIEHKLNSIISAVQEFILFSRIEHHLNSIILLRWQLHGKSVTAFKQKFYRTLPTVTFLWKWITGASLKTLF